MEVTNNLKNQCLRKGVCESFIAVQLKSEWIFLNPHIRKRPKTHGQHLPQKVVNPEVHLGWMKQAKPTVSASIGEETQGKN